MKKESYYIKRSIIIIFWTLLTALFVYRFVIEASNNSDILELIKSSIMIMFGIYEIINTISIIITHKETIEKGIKVPGVIVRPEKQKTFDGETWETNYYLYVKYVDPKTNQEIEFKTEELAFNPFKKLKSSKCNVYINNDIVIAEDFEFTKNKNERVFQQNDMVNPKAEKKSVNLLTVLAVIAIVIGIVIFICAALKKL